MFACCLSAVVGQMIVLYCTYQRDMHPAVGVVVLLTDLCHQRDNQQQSIHLRCKHCCVSFNPLTHCCHMCTAIKHPVILSRDRITTVVILSRDKITIPVAE